MLRYWLRLRDEERRQHPQLPKRDRDILALRGAAWYAEFMARHMHRLADKECRKS